MMNNNPKPMFSKKREREGAAALDLPTNDSTGNASTYRAVSCLCRNVVCHVQPSSHTL